MSATYDDMHLLSQDQTFQNRVESALIAACINVKNEGTTVAYHRERERFVAQVMNNPSQYLPMFSLSVATDANVISDATQNGTVSLSTTGVSVTTQGGFVTDAHILSAIAGQFNSFFLTPSN